MSKRKDFWDTRQGWIFCLNAPEGSENGSHWGYAEDFIQDIYADAESDGQTISVFSEVYGKPYSKFVQLKPGEGIVF